VILVALYLAAIVAANVAIAWVGPSAAIVVAFLFVGLDLTTRDQLHERWRGRHLWARMLTLIVAGGVISWLATPGAGQIAIASTVAFVAASLADWITYVVLRPWHPRARVNGSNVAGAAVDSLLFPTIAFGAFLPWIVAGQLLAKVAGGAIWYELLHALSLRRGAAGSAGHDHT
jgi:queuosine precursor transporter